MGLTCLDIRLHRRYAASRAKKCLSMALHEPSLSCCLTQIQYKGSGTETILIHKRLPRPAFSKQGDCHD